MTAAPPFTPGLRTILAYPAEYREHYGKLVDDVKAVGTELEGDGKKRRARVVRSAVAENVRIWPLDKSEAP